MSWRIREEERCRVTFRRSPSRPETRSAVVVLSLMADRRNHDLSIADDVKPLTPSHRMNHTFALEPVVEGVR